MSQDKRIGWDAERIFSLDFNPQCYNLTPQQIETLLAIFPYINWETRWFNAENHTRDDRMKFAAELMYQLMNPVDCAAIEGENYCIEYPPHSDKITWFPVSPYNDQENRPTFFSTPVWFVVNLGFWDNFIGNILEFITTQLGLVNALQEMTGLQNGDVFTCLFSLAQLEDLHLVFDPPGFSIQVQAPATVELHLVSVPLGGMAYVSVDNDPFELNSFDDIIEIIDTFLDPNDSIIELNIDLISIPPELTSGAHIHEIELTDTDLHTIYVRFLPVVDDALSFIRFGGGLRKIVICGEEANMPSVDCEFIQNCYENNQDNVALQNITVVNMTQTTEEFLQELEDTYVDSPQDINTIIPDAAPVASERNALCHAIKAWLYLYCEAKKTAIRQSSFLSQAWNALQNAIVDAYGVLNNIVGFIVPDNLFSCFVSNSDALAALSNETLIDDLVCCLYDELSGITLLQGSLASALAACSGNDLVCLIQNDMNLQHELNFFYIYGRTLERQNAGTIFECDCETWQQMYIEYDFTISDWGFTSENAVWQEGIGWVGNVTPFGFQGQLAVCTITKTWDTVLPIGWAGGLVYSANVNCGAVQHACLISRDGTGLGIGQNGYVADGENIPMVWTRTTSSPYQAVEFDTLTLTLNPRCCSCPDPGMANIHKARIWLDGASPLQGVPTDVYPVGLGPGGSSSLTFWD